MSVAYFTTPGGEELAILPRQELDLLRQAAHHGIDLADFRSGRLPGLSAEQTRALVAAVTPLAFWRRFRGVTPERLAAAAQVELEALDRLERAKQQGDVATWLRIARALDLPIETLVDER